MPSIPKKKTIRRAKKLVKVKISTKIKPKPKEGKQLKRKVHKVTKKVALLHFAKRVKKSVLVRSEQNPIIAPRVENNWEAWQTFNPGAILLEDKTHFLYRAIGIDGISRLGYAVSNDGLSVDERLSYPAYEHEMKDRVFNIYSCFSGGGWGGSEDPRVVRVGNEDVLYVTYIACDDGLRVTLTSIKVDDFLHKRWIWKKPALISPPGELNKNWLLFSEKINGKYAFLTSIVPEIEIIYSDSLDFDGSHFIHSVRAFGPLKNPHKRCWDKWLRGPGPPPIKTTLGWLVFYHAMDNDWSKYKVGAMLLDLTDPTKILYRSKKPVLVPDQDERHGGTKPGVVYVSGAVVKNGELILYYGEADSYVSVAHAPLHDFLTALKRDTVPIFRRISLKAKK